MRVKGERCQIRRYVRSKLGVERLFDFEVWISVGACFGVDSYLVGGVSSLEREDSVKDQRYRIR